MANFLLFTRYNSNVIRLANNSLVDTVGLYKMALDVVEYPEDIAWLDLSFNDIETVSDDILEFPALKMIYLHGNKIKRFSDLAKLQRLPHLYSLTLHGNPIENYPNYRWERRKRDFQPFWLWENRGDFL